MTVPLPSRRWATRIGVPFAIIAATGAVLAWSAWSWLVPAPTVRATPVLIRSAIPTTESAAAPGAASGPAVQAAGWIEPAPFPIAVTVLTEGVVAEMLVLEGEHAAKDQPVARLVPADAELAVRKAEAEAARRSAMLLSARAQAVRAAQSLEAKIEVSRALAVARAKFDAAQAALNGFPAEDAERRAALAEAEDDLARKTAAAAGGAVAEGELVRLRLRLVALRAATDALTAKHAFLVASVAETQAELDAKRLGSELLIEEKANVATTAADVVAAEAEAELAQAMLAEAALRLDRTEVRSPIDGVVLTRLVGPGSRVGGAGEDARVALVYDPNSVQVRADVPNADIALVGVGATASITLEALPNRTLSGTVTRITGQADIQKNTVQVKIAVTDPPPELRPDMLCRVRIGGAANPSQSASRQRLFAPASLVKDGAAFVIGPLSNGTGVAQRHAVRLGETTPEGWVEVLDGLRPGDLLADPSDVSDGLRVRVALDDSQGAQHGTH